MYSVDAVAAGRLQACDKDKNVGHVPRLRPIAATTEYERLMLCTFNMNGVALVFDIWRNKV